MFSRIFSVIHFNPLALTWEYSNNIEQNMYGDSSSLNRLPNELPISAMDSRRLRIPLLGVTVAQEVEEELLVVTVVFSSFFQESAGISQDNSMRPIPVRKNSKLEYMFYIFLLILVISSSVICSLSHFLSFPSLNTCPFSLILLLIILIAGTSLSLIIPSTACLPR